MAGLLAPSQRGGLLSGTPTDIAGLLGMIRGIQRRTAAEPPRPGWGSWPTPIAPSGAPLASAAYGAMVTPAVLAERLGPDAFRRLMEMAASMAARGHSTGQAF